MGWLKPRLRKTEISWLMRLLWRYLIAAVCAYILSLMSILTLKQTIPSPLSMNEAQKHSPFFFKKIWVVMSAMALLINYTVLTISSCVHIILHEAQMLHLDENLQFCVSLSSVIMLKVYKNLAI